MSKAFATTYESFWEKILSANHRALLVTALLAVGSLSARADGYYHHHPYHWGFYPGISFSYGAYPLYAPVYSYPYYPSYGYEYGYPRPNYAVNGTLLGALTGGLIGNSIHHQGWEGAGIGAAAGLILGGLAEHNARVHEQTYLAPPPVASSTRIANSATVNAAPIAPLAPMAPVAPTVPNSTAVGSTSPRSANALFGR